MLADRGVAVIAAVNNGDSEAGLFVAHMHGERFSVRKRGLIGAQKLEPRVSASKRAPIALEREFLGHIHAEFPRRNELSMRCQVGQAAGKQTHTWFETNNSLDPVVADDPGLNSSIQLGWILGER